MNKRDYLAALTKLQQILGSDSVLHHGPGHDGSRRAALQIVEEISDFKADLPGIGSMLSDLKSAVLTFYDTDERGKAFLWALAKIADLKKLPERVECDRVKWN